MPSACILHKGRSREKSIDFILQSIQDLPLDATWKVRWEQVKSSRSLKQNAYYRGCVVEAISDATGYEPDEVHEYLCGIRWGWKDKKVPKTPRNPFGVESVPIRTTTTDEDGHRAVLGRLKFAEFIEFARRLAAQKLSLVIPDPDKFWIEHQREAA